MISSQKQVWFKQLESNENEGVGATQHNTAQHVHVAPPTFLHRAPPTARAREGRWGLTILWHSHHLYKSHFIIIFYLVPFFLSHSISNTKHFLIICAHHISRLYLVSFHVLVIFYFLHEVPLFHHLLTSSMFLTPCFVYLSCDGRLSLPLIYNLTLTK